MQPLRLLFGSLGLCCGQASASHSSLPAHVESVDQGHARSLRGDARNKARVTCGGDEGEERGKEEVRGEKMSNAVVFIIVSQSV